MDVAEIVQSVSLIVAALSVVFGVNAWQREFVGKRRIELAEDALALFYEARDAIRYIRSPLGHVGEGSSRQAAENESPREKEIYDRASVVFERYNKHQELFNKIHSMRYRFISHFGKGAAQPFDDLRSIVNDIFFSSFMLARYWSEQDRRYWRNDEERQKHLQEIDRWEAVFWDRLSDKDPITPRLEAVVLGIETRCRAIIERKTIEQRAWGFISKLWQRE
jgi:hypothetical protein